MASTMKAVSPDLASPLASQQQKKKRKDFGGIKVEHDSNKEDFKNIVAHQTKTAYKNREA